jgi:hypothetical protein
MLQRKFSNRSAYSLFGRSRPRLVAIAGSAYGTAAAESCLSDWQLWDDLPTLAQQTMAVRNQRLAATSDRRKEDRTRQTVTGAPLHFILLRCCHKERSQTDPLTSTLPVAGRYLIAMGRSAFAAKLLVKAFPLSDRLMLKTDTSLQQADCWHCRTSTVKLQCPTSHLSHLGSPLNRTSSTGGLQEVDRGSADARLVAAAWAVLYGTAGRRRVPCNAPAHEQQRVRARDRTSSRGCGNAGA